MINNIDTEEKKDAYIAILEREVIVRVAENLRLKALIEVANVDSADHDDDLLDWAKSQAEEAILAKKSDVSRMLEKMARR